jgi:hypothetical protein
MIRFSCKCGFEFKVAEDRAGGTVQCPRCALLVDIPRADELAWLAPDGTYALDETAVAPAVPGQTLAEMYRAFSRKTRDDDGVEKDLRPDEEHFRRIGDEPDVQTHRPVRIAPHYDPVTGERIVPLSLMDEDPQAVLPLAVLVDPSEPEELPEAILEPDIPVATAVSPVFPVRSLGYATGATGHSVSVTSLAVDLLVRPANVTVLFFIYWFYLAAYLLKIPLTTYALFLHVPPPLLNLVNLPLWLLAAHYGCVVEDVGPEAIDELPRPLRNFSLGEDLFGPMLRVAAAGVICYGPMIVVTVATGLEAPPAAAATVALAAAGTFLFPAVVLTLLTGTTVLNLTPGRVIGVIGHCGPQYALSVVMAGLAGVLSIWIVLGPAVLPVIADIPGAHAADHVAVLVPGLALTAYVTHWFAGHLGLMYRAHHDSFPWMAQRHVRTPRPAAAGR